ncbi:MAG: response regulator transcription factor [Deltaproteobacteria bacterium]|nr:response regulator transcription factor [Deltaproteobacteria bacterium]
MTIKIVLVDDHKIMREGIRAMLETENSLEVVSEAENGREALEIALDIKPDIIIMDINMPDMNGTEATRQIRKSCPETRIIALSMHSDRFIVTDMLQAGASGYLLKDCSGQDIITAIRTVHAGKNFLSPEITGVVIEDYIQKSSKENPKSPAQLTTKEREVLQLIAEGNTSKEISSHLNIATKTVDSHRINIMNKLDIHNIAELTKFAIRYGITDLDS